ncbi:MAG: type II toxin-antitoxin system VapB family antitoxin [Deltaproteobacteria bacterium]|nr:type II toxin-antitoxin system VapB family antitoxin [Deltaproteobacteria bacterium]
MGRSVRRVCTTLDIPDELMEEAQRLLGFKSKIHTVLVSLRESVRRHRVKEMMGLLGAIELDVDVPRSRRRPRTGQPRPRGRNA